MKKHWQIKPWVFIVLVAVILGGLVYVFAGEFFVNYSSSDSRQELSYNEGVSAPMYDMAINSEESYGISKSMDTSFVGTSVDSVIPRMMIKTGTISIVVDDVNKSIENIVTYVDGNGGFLVTSNVDKYGSSFNGYLTVRVPSAFLNDAILYIKGLGEVKSEHVDSSDITEEYIDLDAQLKNLKVTENQFVEIMKRAVKVEDVLSVQRELGYVRGEINRIEGRMKYLDQSVSLSSLTVNLSTNPAVIPVITEEDKWEPLSIFKDALRSLLDTGRGLLNALIWVGVYLPIVLVFVFIAWSLRKYFMMRKKKYFKVTKKKS